MATLTPALPVASKVQFTDEKLPFPRLRAPPPLDTPVLNSIRSKRTILASASPRRRQLLAQIGLTNLEIAPSNHPENLPKESLTPWEYVRATANAKCLAAYRDQIDHPTRGDPELIIAADTVVVGYGGEILEKPRSEKAHIEMLTALRDGGRVNSAALNLDEHALGLGEGFRGEGAGVRATVTKDKLTGGWHKVLTAVSVLAPLESAREPGYAMESIVEETGVRFDPSVSDELILAYVRTREGADKAGGYGIQGMGTLLVDRIEGTYDNVVGLPLRATLALVEKVLKIAERDEDAVDNEEMEPLDV